jgi:cell division protein ZapA
MSGLVKITVTLANRKYTLSVEKEDEMVIRNATESINSRIKDFNMHYPGKDMQDILAMILLNTSAALAKKDNSEDSGSKEELLSRLSEINQLLVKAV